MGRTWERFGTAPDPSWLPDGLVDDTWFTQLGVRFLAPVRRYQDQRDCRWAAQRAVLDQLPKSGSIILIAHSLGSVVAVDLLTKLHPNLRVDLLVTIGSPLAIKHLGHSGFEAEFPYDRVGGWVNLYDSGDFVTIGRGVGRRFPAACDIAVQTGQAQRGCPPQQSSRRGSDRTSRIWCPRRHTSVLHPASAPPGVAASASLVRVQHAAPVVH